MWLGHRASAYNYMAPQIAPRTVYESGEVFGPHTILSEGAGIAYVASIIAHEKLHIQRYFDFAASISANPSIDLDVDGIPGLDEILYADLGTHPSDADTFGRKSSLASGDEEVRCEYRERDHSVPIDAARDWSNPGSQSADIYCRGWNGGP